MNGNSAHDKARTTKNTPEPHVLPASPVPLSLCVSEPPLSNGHGPEAVLKALAAQNACTQGSSARKRLFKLVRDLRAIEEGIGCELEIADVTLALKEWYRLSQPFLDAAKKYEDYLTEFLAAFRKVRVPTGKGDQQSGRSRFKTFG